MRVTAIIAAGGRGSRLGSTQPKQLLAIGGRTILARSLDAFVRHPRIDGVIVALPADVAADPPAYLRDPRVTLVEGGDRRQDSVARAFARVPDGTDIVIIHDAARPFATASLIDRTIDAADAYGAAIAALPVTDTVKRADARRVIVDTIPRSEIFLAQTPQAFRTSVLREALAAADGAGEATDEAMLAERAGHRVRLVDGEQGNIKITTAADLEMAETMIGGKVGAVRIGNGYDLHVLVAGRPLVLGGVPIPFDKGLQGHSDADAVCHAVTDAVLGAAGAGDIGRHFPDTDAAWKGADSIALLTRAVAIVRDAGYRVSNVDVVVVAQQPKLSPHVDAMRANLARALGVNPSQVSVKGKTNEGVDAVGRGDAIAVHAVALVTGL
ncbi:MAG: 2-C-methyl-D-erythritol 4-phosphate cytidylyltransferase [Vicinamibacterales bacterium]